MFRRMFTKALLIGALSGALYAADVPGVWLDVPFVKQEKDGCGAASIAMVMQYWQQQRSQPASPDADAIQIQHLLYSAKARGIDASDTERYFQKGIPYIYNSRSREDLKQHLDKRRPLIVALKPEGGRAPLHYVVVTGMDQQVVMVNDPAQRKLLKQDGSSLERQMSAADKWGLPASP